MCGELIKNGGEELRKKVCINCYINHERMPKNGKWEL